MSEPAVSPRDQGARLLQQGNVEGAIQHLEAVVEVDPYDAHALGYLGAAYAWKGDHGSAVAALQRACRIASEDEGLGLNLAIAYTHAHRYDDARAEAMRVLSLNPAHAGARQLLGQLPGGQRR